MSNRTSILLFADWYEPGFKGGGPIRSCVNFVWNMKEDYEIYVFTADRDLGSDSPYPGIVVDQWITRPDGVKLLYASPSFLSWTNIRQLVKTIDPDFIYLNSMFSTYFSVMPMFMKRAGGVRASVILAPRGMLKRSALAYKPRKKQLFLSMMRIGKITRNILFHATDEAEVFEIQQVFGKGSRVSCIPNFHGLQFPFTEPPQKKQNEIKIIFVGRIHPIKNLYYLLECLVKTDADIHLTVVGTIEDKDYWEQCKKMMRDAPANIHTEIISDAPHHDIERLIREHHLFALLTTGENFGHAIFESLAAGRPVLISDQTPWRQLEASGAGWDIPLSDAAAIISVISKTAAMDHESFKVLCKNAWNYCSEYLERSTVKEAYRELFTNEP